ncbi:MAG TPA: hypothetical protein VMR62_23525 [Bryobacteraceae bacterium]|nr:hypothetical protein [Bryobacteraceae bacterium]
MEFFQLEWLTLAGLLEDLYARIQLGSDVVSQLVDRLLEAAHDIRLAHNRFQRKAVQGILANEYDGLAPPPRL